MCAPLICRKCYIIFWVYIATAAEDSHRSPDSSKQGQQQQQQRTKEKTKTKTCSSSEEDGLPFYFAGHRYRKRVEKNTQKKGLCTYILSSEKDEVPQFIYSAELYNTRPAHTHLVFY